MIKDKEFNPKRSLERFVEFAKAVFYCVSFYYVMGHSEFCRRPVFLNSLAAFRFLAASCIRIFP